MKIKKLRLRNFAQFQDFECEFDGSVTRLVGVNGSGKTTIGLTAIWAAFRGIAEKSGKGQIVGERFRFIGSDGKAAHIELQLIDEATGRKYQLYRRIDNSGNSIEITSNDGPVEPDYFANLLNVSFLSAKHFTALDAKSQALLLGIDTSEYDKRIADIKEEAKVIRRRISDIGTPDQVPEVKRANTPLLLTELKHLQKFNEEQEVRQRALKHAERDVEDAIENVEELRADLEMAEERLKEARAALEAAVEPEELKDTSEVEQKLNSASIINDQAAAYENYQAKVKALGEAKSELEANLKEQDMVKAERLQHIQSFKFPMGDLSVDDDGCLQLDGRPIKDPYFSRGELEMIVAELYMLQNPDLKLRFIDYFEVLDQANQQKILDELLEKGFQVIVAEVGEKSKGKNSILLRECKVIEGE